MVTVENLNQKLRHDPWYTVRRYFVDRFFIQNIDKFPVREEILDIGGHKEGKRGMFNIQDYDISVKYANIDPETKPDYLGSAARIEVADCAFAGAILGEVLEHVEDPTAILKEAFRVMKPSATLLITTPFMLHVHADPYDFYRYTDYWYQTNLKKIGFRNIVVEKQGGFFAVLANMLKMWSYALRTDPQAWSPIPRTLLNFVLRKLIANFMAWDENDYYSQHRIFGNHTTGFGVICQKPLN